MAVKQNTMCQSGNAHHHHVNAIRVIRFLMMKTRVESEVYSVSMSAKGFPAEVCLRQIPNGGPRVDGEAIHGSIGSSVSATMYQIFFLLGQCHC